MTDAEHAAEIGEAARRLNRAITAARSANLQVYAFVDEESHGIRAASAARFFAPMFVFTIARPVGSLGGIVGP